MDSGESTDKFRLIDNGKGGCAAFGCPLAGSMGSAGHWWCFCHHEASDGSLQAVTAAIRASSPLWETVMDIRSNLFSDDWDEAYRQIKFRIKQANDAGKEAKYWRFQAEKPLNWLYRLEGLLFMQVVLVKVERHKGPKLATVPIIGPTKAVIPHQYKDES